jgi:hypothetical protein
VSHRKRGEQQHEVGTTGQSSYIEHGSQLEVGREYHDQTQASGDVRMRRSNSLHMCEVKDIGRYESSRVGSQPLFGRCMTEARRHVEGTVPRDQDKFRTAVSNSIPESGRCRRKWGLIRSGPDELLRRTAAQAALTSFTVKEESVAGHVVFVTSGS